MVSSESSHVFFFASLKLFFQNFQIPASTIPTSLPHME